MRRRTVSRGSRWLASAILLGSSMLLAFACGNSETEPEGKCDPGTNVFCRCPGGDPGTRECLDNGEDFDECVVAPGTPCGERVECVEGSTVPCLCPSGESGLKECLRDEASYGECMVSAGVPCPIAPNTSSGPGPGGGPGTGGGGGAPPTCDHELCETGEPLSASCGDCAAAVCAADDYCCTTKWDVLCLDVVDAECDNLCSGPQECAHELCVTGEALDPLCDPCVESICMVDDVCCGAMFNGMPGTWDELCVDSVTDGTHPACAGKCGCVHDECVTGVKLDPMCSTCAATICSEDAYCCDNQWDALCVSKASNEPLCGCP